MSRQTIIPYMVRRVRYHFYMLEMTEHILLGEQDVVVA